MRAVGIFPSRKEARVIEHPEPRIEGPSQAKIRMLEVGVCGTDKDICAFLFGTPPPGSDYLVLGHESLGEVVEAGPEATGIKPGDLVVSVVRLPCGEDTCIACRSRRQDFCVTGGYREHGIKSLHGFMTEYVVARADELHTIPQALRDIAVLIEPLTIAEKSLIEVRAIQERLPWWGYRHRAVVLGAGPVGLLGAMALRLMDFEVIVYSRSRKPNPKAAVAEAIGAEYVSSEDTSPEKLGTIDLIYEAAGAPQLAFEVLKFLGPNGIFVFTGIPKPEHAVSIDLDAIMNNLVMKNQIVLGTVNAGHDAFEGAIRDLGTFAERWPQAVRSLITGRFRMEDFRDPVTGRAGGIKNVIRIA